ncbi:MAG: DNA polymerase III subunit gamma/tau [Phycisphaerae bacterium]
MAGYLVLARKYRSQTFEEVVGQEAIAQTLVNAIKTGRVHHAYLFTGTRGVGKTTMARILAKALNCLSTEEPTPQPCNECEACEAISRGDDVDVVEIDGASNRGIDEIRELRANAIFRPARCRYKVYYIDEVHMLTKEAFNALLKTLEEPPEHVKFIFATTEVEKVPATIVSRCQRFDFRNIPTQRIADHLQALCAREDVPADEEALFRVARAASGSMRDALSLLDQLLSAGGRVTADDVVRVLGTPPDERTQAMVGSIATGDTPAVLGELSGMVENGIGLPSIVTALADAFRNTLIAKTCGPDSELIELPADARAAIGKLAPQLSVPTLVQAVAVLDTCSRNLRGSSVGRALVEAALVRLSEAEKFVDSASLIERLEALGASGGGSPVVAQKKKPLSSPVGREGSRCVPAGTVTRQPMRTNAPQPPAQQPTPPPQGQPSQGAPPQPPAEQDAPEPDEPREFEQPLSMQEKTEIQEDPAVQEVLSLFGGKVVGFRRISPDMPAPAESDSIEDEDDSVET